MAKCQYKRECDLPPTGTQDQADHIRRACDQRATALLGYSAKLSTAKWQLPEVQLRGAIIRHITAGRKMFQKYKDDGSGTLLLGHVQANITLPTGFDVYVEMILMEKGMIIINAHDHTPGKLLLPQ